MRQSRAPADSVYHQCTRSTYGRTPEDRDLKMEGFLWRGKVVMLDNKAWRLTRLTFVVCVAGPDRTPQRCARFPPLFTPLTILF